MGLMGLMCKSELTALALLRMQANCSGLKLLTFKQNKTGSQVIPPMQFSNTCEDWQNYQLVLPAF